MGLGVRCTSTRPSQHRRSPIVCPPLRRQRGSHPRRTPERWPRLDSRALGRGNRRIVHVQYRSVRRSVDRTPHLASLRTAASASTSVSVVGSESGKTAARAEREVLTATFGVNPERWLSELSRSYRSYRSYRSHYRGHYRATIGPLSDDYRIRSSDSTYQSYWTTTGLLSELSGQ